ncbi:S9 family peptidase [Lederbergia graminis]|uniref:S9 family peptidase n=1 Tax=Lederbergia graminis TaxID=735518 RepID=A0ABW0LGX8_9BACI
MSRLVELEKEQLINDVIKMDYYRYQDLCVSPDDQEALVVFGNDMLEEEYFVNDISNRSLWKLNLSSGDSKMVLAEDEDAHSPCWSPDSNKIAYLSRKSGKTELWVMNRDGSDKRQLTNTDAQVENPFDHAEICWSPDGSKIAYTLIPNGSRIHLNNEFRIRKPSEDIIVHKTRKQDNHAFYHYITSKFKVDLNVLDVDTGINDSLICNSPEEIEFVDWDGVDNLVVKINSKLHKVSTKTKECKQIYSDYVGVTKRIHSIFYIANVLKSEVDISILQEGEIKSLHKINLPGYEIKIHDWSQDAKQIVFTAREGISVYLYTFDISTGTLMKHTKNGKIVHSPYTHKAGPKFLHTSNDIVFPYAGPSEPMEIWKLDKEELIYQISSKHKNKIQFDIPESRIIRYESEGWEIESLLVLPKNAQHHESYPTLVFLHGGPEGANLADFTQLNSGGGLSAAFFLASKGFAVFLPNFRGSSGYGSAFEKELGNLNMKKNPYKDVMSGVDYLIERGIANPDKLGIYGMSYGASLSTWTVSQTNRFKGAIGICGVHDWLQWDRDYGVPFYAFNPNRKGEADPKNMWLRTETYKQISPLENIESIHCPVLLIETGGERSWNGARWRSDAKSLFLGLDGLGKETSLVCYTKAFHTGGWNRKYQKDYVNRISAWFDYCLNGVPLPEWFNRSDPK